MLRLLDQSRQIPGLDRLRCGFGAGGRGRPLGIVFRGPVPILASGNSCCTTAPYRVESPVRMARSRREAGNDSAAVPCPGGRLPCRRRAKCTQESAKVTKRSALSDDSAIVTFDLGYLNFKGV